MNGFNSHLKAKLFEKIISKCPSHFSENITYDIFWTPDNILILVGCEIVRVFLQNNTLNSSTQVTTPTSVITPTPNVTGNDSSNYNKIDQYGKKKGSDKKRISNSKYSVDKRNRTDVLNSTKTVSTKKRTIVPSRVSCSIHLLEIL